MCKAAVSNFFAPRTGFMLSIFSCHRCWKHFSAFVAISGCSALILIQKVSRDEVISNILLTVTCNLKELIFFLHGHGRFTWDIHYATLSVATLVGAVAFKTCFCPSFFTLSSLQELIRFVFQCRVLGFDVPKQFWRLLLPPQFPRLRTLRIDKHMVQGTYSSAHV